MSNLPAFKLVVPTDFEYVDRTLATASWYDIYTIKAGEYPVTFVSIQGHPVERIEDAYYARWDVAAVKTSEYRVNRLFTASSSSTTHPNEETTVRDSMYDYEVLRPRTDVIEAYVSHTTDEHGKRHRNVNATIVPA